MKLLIITQKIDRNDAILGFFHSWILEFAKKFEKVTVICLESGECDFPRNVQVFSMGKEKSNTRTDYIRIFLSLIWSLRNDYDSVFVHMNQEYVLLGGILWKLMGKKIAMWRNHAYGNMATRIAVLLSDKVFCTSPNSYTAKFNKTKVMPAGIDVDLYQKSEDPKQNSILFFGRISPIKNIHIFVESLKILDKKNIDFHADIIGSAPPVYKSYEQKLHESGFNLEREGKLSYLPEIPHAKIGRLYGKYALYVNLTPSGSLDKTMLEAMSAYVPILISNSAFRGKIPDICELKKTDPISVAEAIESILKLNRGEKQKIGQQLREYATDSHSIKILISLLASELS